MGSGFDWVWAVLGSGTALTKSIFSQIGNIFGEAPVGSGSPSDSYSSSNKAMIYDVMNDPVGYDSGLI